MGFTLTEVGGQGCRPCGTPSTIEREYNMETIEEQLKSAFRLRDSLNAELSRAEIMSDRIPIRKDLRELNGQISELKIKQQLFWKSIFKNVEEGE